MMGGGAFLNIERGECGKRVSFLKEWRAKSEKKIKKAKKTSSPKLFLKW